MSPELTQIVTLAVFLVAVGVVLYQQHKAGKPFTVADIAAAVEAAKPITDRVRTVAEGVVLAVEQVKRDNKLTNAEAFREAFAAIRTQLDEAGIPRGQVTDEKIIEEINRAVLIASSLTAQIEAVKGKKRVDPFTTTVGGQPLHE